MGEVIVIKGDITQLELPVEAVVNAANTSLLCGSGAGVNGAIHEAGGQEVYNACKQIRIKLGGCQTGDAVLTTAGNMPYKYVIHAVGPVWQGGKLNEDVLLAEAYLNSMKLAAENGVTAIAYPNISTGIYGFPREKAAEIAVEAVYRGLVRNPEIRQVYFVCHNDTNLNLYKNLIENA